MDVIVHFLRRNSAYKRGLQPFERARSFGPRTALSFKYQDDTLRVEAVTLPEDAHVILSFSESKHLTYRVGYGEV